MSTRSSVLYQLFDVCEANPQKVAMVLDDQAWTYGELIGLVERVALYLHFDFGIRPGQIIYQYMDRSLEMVCGILAILCAGAVYCPLNPDDPPARICSLINETRGRFVLLHQGTWDRFPLSALDIVRLINDNTVDYNPSKMMTVHKLERLSF